MWSRFGILIALAASGVAPQSLRREPQALAGGISMQDAITAIPQCALQCMSTIIPKYGCGLLELDCICTNEPLTADMMVCLQASCTVKEQLATQRFQKVSCGAEVRDLSGNIKAIIWSLYSLAAVFVVARLLGRMSSHYSWDDWTIVACLIALTPTAAIAHKMVDSGLGKDVWMLEPDQITNTLFFFFIEEHLYTFSVTFTKISVLLLYLRIFTTRCFRFQCYALIAVTGMFGSSCIISAALSCTPVNFIWQRWDGEHVGSCFDVNKQTFAAAGINMSLDAIIFLLPIPQLLPLQMTLRKKVGIIMMFAVGLFVTLTSILRLQTILEWGLSLNPTYDYTNLAVWSLVEIDVGVMCACMPGVFALFRTLWPKLMSGTGWSSRDNNSRGTPDHHNGGGSGSSLKTFGSLPSAGRKINKTTSVSVTYRDAGDTGSEELELVGRESGDRKFLPPGLPSYAIPAAYAPPGGRDGGGGGGDRKDMW